MSESIVIHAESLGKRYVLGHRPAVHDTLRDALTGGARDLVRSLRGRGRRRSADDTIWALRDVSFELRRGEVLGVIGRNGAGTSTLLKILSRITEPTTGSAWIRGRVGSLLEVGTGFHGELTGRENIYLSGAILGMRRREIARKFDEIVDFAEIERFIDTPVKRYSSGMYLRLAFAVAAHLEPDILLVDEVLAVGDAAFQKKCLGKMSDVARQDRTVLFVSHNLVAVETLCGRALWLEAGQISRDGQPSLVIEEYLRTVSSSVTERTWPAPAQAPGVDGLRLHRVCVRPADGDPSDRLTVHTPFVLECEYHNDHLAGALRVDLQLYDEKELLLFDVGPPFEPDVASLGSPPGLLRTVCHVPGDLLNDGRYRVAVTILRDKVPVIRHADALVFDIQDSVEGRGEEWGEGWYEKWPGAIRPRLRWDTNIPVRTTSP
jgi:lipopolysaccharide transport system ATP-binding protein